jgi:peptidyl-prolyl cis-trans isomerase C
MRPRRGYSRRYQGIKDNLAATEKAEAAHIIVHVSEQRSEAEARRLIEEAEAELAKSIPFAAVAERFSDCKGNGGDLDWFERGVMVSTKSSLHSNPVSAPASSARPSVITSWN